MLNRLRSLGRGTKMFMLAAVVPPAGLLIESTCSGGLCTACPLSGGCTAAVGLSIGAVLGVKLIRQTFFSKKDVASASTVIPPRVEADTG